MGVLETKMTDDKVVHVKNSILHDFEVHNSGGRLWVMWDPIVLKVHISKTTEQAIFMQALYYTTMARF